MSKNKSKAPKFQASTEDMQAIIDCIFPEGVSNPATSLSMTDIASETHISVINVRTIVSGLRKAGISIELPGGSRYAAFARSLGVEAPPASSAATG